MDTALTSETGCPVMADKGFTVDPFLVEALQNPRHRLTNGNGSRIFVTKTTESSFPAVRLSEIPAKQSEEIGKFEHMKVAINPRPSKGSGMEADELEKKGGLLKSVEERKEDYDRARARIFKVLADLDCNDSSSETNPWRVTCSPRRGENQVL